MNNRKKSAKFENHCEIFLVGYIFFSVVTIITMFFCVIKFVSIDSDVCVGK